MKVLDFGVEKRKALASPQSSGNLTRTGALVGTPFYMSPEQVLGEDDVDARADNLGQVISAVAMTPIAPIERLMPGVPPALAELLVRLLRKARDGRPRAMDEVRVALAHHESERLAARLDLNLDLDREQAPPGASACSGPQPLSMMTAHPAPRGDGDATFEGAIDVRVGETAHLDAVLRPLAPAGQLRLEDPTNDDAEVVVDRVQACALPAATGSPPIAYRGSVSSHFAPNCFTAPCAFAL